MMPQNMNEALEYFEIDGMLSVNCRPSRVSQPQVQIILRYYPS